MVNTQLNSGNFFSFIGPSGNLDSNQSNEMINPSVNCFIHELNGNGDSIDIYTSLSPENSSYSENSDCESDGYDSDLTLESSLAVKPSVSLNTLDSKPSSYQISAHSNHLNHSPLDSLPNQPHSIHYSNHHQPSNSCTAILLPTFSNIDATSVNINSNEGDFQESNSVYLTHYSNLSNEFHSSSNQSTGHESSDSIQSSSNSSTISPSSSYPLSQYDYSNFYQIHYPSSSSIFSSSSSISSSTSSSSSSQLSNITCQNNTSNDNLNVPISLIDYQYHHSYTDLSQSIASSRSVESFSGLLSSAENVKDFRIISPVSISPQSSTNLPNSENYNNKRSEENDQDESSSQQSSSSLPDPSPVIIKQSSLHPQAHEDVSENLGEIIKKTIVESVTA